MPAAHPPSLLPALVLPYVAWRVYRRFHRNVGRQLLHPGRLVSGLVVFSLLVVLLAALCYALPRVLAGLGLGVLLGGLLALLGLHLTKFETGETKPHYYTPNTYIGVALTLLLAGRVIYRVGVLYFSDAVDLGAAPSFMQSPLTMFVIGLTSGYYIAYNSGVLIRSNRMK
jgi:hypothetical protein